MDAGDRDQATTKEGAEMGMNMLVAAAIILAAFSLGAVIFIIISAWDRDAKDEWDK